MLIEGQPLRCESMTGHPTDRLVDLIGRVREIVGDQWEKPPIGRPHVLPLPTAVIAVLFGLRHGAKTPSTLVAAILITEARKAGADVDPLG